eukprot:TRINITY_DN9605_c0_g2_i1.p1 TRINITY_DN9605_c0_g2~~TRINITY_DN9605_c0_g2_i1.p1  ORF type:complete len:1060 (+),score=333.57 TRINITY_DN9605_c0_g2_i1:51-3230(+)
MDILNSKFNDSDESDDNFDPEADGDDSDHEEEQSKQQAEESDDDDDGDNGYQPAATSTAKRGYDSSDDDEDEAAEDEDDNDDDDNDRPAKKRPKGNQFVLDSAAVADNEEDDYDDDDDDIVRDDNQLQRLQRDAEARLERRFRQTQGQDALAFDDDDDNDDEDDDVRGDSDRFRALNARREEEEIQQAHQKILERHRNTVYRDDDDEDYDMQGLEDQQVLPKVTDPRLFMIKCAPGKEQEVAIQLMRKALDAAKRGEPLGIKSVVGYPSKSVKGGNSYVYVEAYKQKQVKEAIDGLDALRYGQYKQDMVAIKDMPAILRVNRLNNKLKPDSWVRVRRGLYANDIGRVVKVSTNDARARVQVQLVPRIDMSSERHERKRSKAHRPPPRLFDPEAIRSALGEDNIDMAMTNDGHYMFESNRYVDGFLHKTMPISSLVTERVKPTLDEITLFEGSVDMAAAADAQAETKFVVGDRVIVTKGELEGLEASILQVKDAQILIKPEDARMQGISEIPVAAEDLRKLFKPADHVKINRGRHEGETGLVIHVGQHDVSILSDLAMKELKVLARDLEMCASVGTGLDQLGKFSLYDLVQINGAPTVGCIIGIDREELRLLDQLGNQRTVKTQQVQLRNQRQKVQALDKFQSVVTKGSTAKAVEGNNKGKEGKVLHLHRGYVFLHQRTQIENNGVFVAKARHLQVAGSRASTRAGASAAQRGGAQSPRVGARSGGGQMARRRPRQHPLLYKTVRITKGPHKTYMGIVKDASESTVRVELHANCKTLNVKPSQVKVIPATSQERNEQRDAPLEDGYMQAQTPLYGATTPMYGATTPAHGAQTPRYGSETPRAGNETPGGNRTEYDQNDNAWNPAVPNTPHSNNGMDFEDDEIDQAFTPGGPNSVDATTPYSGMYGASEEGGTPSGATPTAYTPGETPNEPASIMGGYTPGFAAQTPGADTSSAWHRPGVYVLFGDSSEGVIVQVDADTCTVETSNGSRDPHPMADLAPCRPAKDDSLLVFQGDGADSVGTLLTIDNMDGVVSIPTADGGSDIKILPMQNLVKFNTDYDLT